MTEKTVEAIEPQAVVPQKVAKTLTEEFGEELQALLNKYPTIRLTVGAPPINISEIVPAPANERVAEEGK